MKKKIAAIALTAFTLTAFTACNSQENYSTPTEGDSGIDTNTDIEADTSITLDPDTTTEHDMAL